MVYKDGFSHVYIPRHKGRIVPDVTPWRRNYSCACIEYVLSMNWATTLKFYREDMKIVARHHSRTSLTWIDPIPSLAHVREHAWDVTDGRTQTHHSFLGDGRALFI